MKVGCLCWTRLVMINQRFPDFVYKHAQQADEDLLEPSSGRAKEITVFLSCFNFSKEWCTPCVSIAPERAAFGCKICSARGCVAQSPGSAHNKVQGSPSDSDSGKQDSKLESDCWRKWQNQTRQKGDFISPSFAPTPRELKQSGSKAHGNTITDIISPATDFTRAKGDAWLDGICSSVKLSYRKHGQRVNGMCRVPFVYLWTQQRTLGHFQS